MSRLASGERTREKRWLAEGEGGSSAVAPKERDLKEKEISFRPSRHGSFSLPSLGCRNSLAAYPGRFTASTSSSFLCGHDHIQLGLSRRTREVLVSIETKPSASTGRLRENLPVDLIRASFVCRPHVTFYVLTCKNASPSFLEMDH